MNETGSKTKAILHPVRARILVTLNDRPLTPRRIAAALPDIPLGTVYRHINILHDAGLLKVVGERRVKGTLERQFAVVEAATFINDKEMEALTGEDIMGLVSAVSGVIQSGFARYVQHAELPPKPGDISFVAKSLYLTHEEYMEFRGHMVTLLGKAGRSAGPGLERRMVGYFSAPDPELASLGDPED